MKEIINLLQFTFFTIDIPKYIDSQLTEVDFKKDEAKNPPNQKSFASVVIKNEKEFLLIDGVESVVGYDSIDNLTYSPDGVNISYRVHKDFMHDKKGEDGKYLVVCNGITGNEYDFIYSLIYSPDGKSFAYKAEQNGQSFVVKDDVEGPRYISISSIYYSPYGEILYSARRDGRTITEIETNIKKIRVKLEANNGVNHDVFFENDVNFLANDEMMRHIKNVMIKDGVEYDNIFIEIGNILYYPAMKNIVFRENEQGVVEVVTINKFTQFLIKDSIKDFFKGSAQYFSSKSKNDNSFAVIFWIGVIILIVLSGRNGQLWVHSILNQGFIYIIVVTFAICIPLLVFKKTRDYSTIGFLISSYITGAIIWLWLVWYYAPAYILIGLAIYLAIGIRFIQRDINKHPDNISYLTKNAILSFSVIPMAILANIFYGANPWPQYSQSVFLLITIISGLIFYFGYKFFTTKLAFSIIPIATLVVILSGKMGEIELGQFILPSLLIVSTFGLRFLSVYLAVRIDDSDKNIPIGMNL